MKAIYWQKGKVMDIKNNGVDKIEAGDIVIIKNRIGVAGCDVAINEAGTLHVVGVYEIPKAETEAVEYGDALYYDSENEVVTKTVSGVKAGYAFQSRATGDKTILVKID